MPKLFNDFDLDLETINIGIAPCEDSGGDSVNVCNGGSGGEVPTTAPTCWNVCN